MVVIVLLSHLKAYNDDRTNDGDCDADSADDDGDYY